MKNIHWTATFLLVAAGFVAGRLTTGPTVKAAQDHVQVDIRTVAAESALVAQYPDQKKVYVYLSPMVGAPTIYCSYSFTLSSPGGRITREQCPAP